MSEKIKGYHGMMMTIDLTDQTTREDVLDPEDLRLFLGGRGLGAAMLLRMLPPDTDPLGEDNVLIFSTGPLVGTKAPGADRYVLHTKSPQTGLYNFSVSGGQFGRKMKATGYDVIVIKGRSPEPVYIQVQDDGVKIKDASHLWGMGTQVTQEFIRGETSPDVGITCIGPAGENLAPYACMINERRALGRGGVGAVMGSKNLKALVVRGKRQAELADPEGFKEAIKKGAAELQGNPMTSKVLTMYGSASMLNNLKDHGILPGNNWLTASLDEAESITAQKMREYYLVKDVACSTGCPVKCSKMFMVRGGDWAGSVSEGPDYETVYAFGSCCGVYDLGAIIHADAICDDLGLDTISAGVSISFVMECVEKGLLDAKSQGYPNLAFGDAEGMINLIRDIAYRKGLGAFVAKGTLKMAEELGKGSYEFAMHAKGMELGGYDPRGAKGMSLVYACGPRGGCHHSGGYTVIPEMMNPNIDRFAEAGKAPLVAGSRNRRASFCDSGLICAFVAIGLSDETAVDMLNSATGLNYAPGDLYKIGDRISCVERAFNCREGLERSDDTLPRRLLAQTVDRGPSQDHKVDDLETMKDEFYEICGWDKVSGLPLAEHLRDLEVGWVSDYLG